jgi:hypothetical protein
VDQANQDGTRVGGRLWRVARTTSLLLGLGLMGALFVDLPANYDQAKITYVPANGPWIKLGADRSDAQRPGVAMPYDDITARSEETK